MKLASSILLLVVGVLGLVASSTQQADGQTGPSSRWSAPRVKYSPDPDTSFSLYSLYGVKNVPYTVPNGERVMITAWSLSGSSGITILINSVIATQIQSLSGRFDGRFEVGFVAFAGDTIDITGDGFLACHSEIGQPALGTVSMPYIPQSDEIVRFDGTGYVVPTHRRLLISSWQSFNLGATAIFQINGQDAWWSMDVDSNGRASAQGTLAGFIVAHAGDVISVNNGAPFHVQGFLRAE